MNKEELKALSDETFFDNDAGEIQPKAQRRFNDEMIAALAAKDEVCNLVPYTGENLVTNSAISKGAWYWFGAQYAMPITIDIIQGQTYTVSFDVVSSDGDGVVSLFLSANHGNESGQHTLYVRTEDIGKRISGTFIANDNYPKGSVLSYRGGNNTGGTFVNTKLERGSKATPYTPNPTDIARAMDYSILTEQIVPGNHYLDFEGNNKKVYMQTFVGVMSDTLGGGVTLTIPSISNILSFNGYVLEEGLNGANIWPPFYQDDNALWVYYFRKDDGRLFLQAKGSRAVKGLYTITIKYTK